MNGAPVLAGPRAEGLVPGRPRSRVHRGGGSRPAVVSVPGQDTVLGPEMRATGEVMNLGPDVGVACAKSLRAAGHEVPNAGTLFLSLADCDKAIGIETARIPLSAGFRIFNTPRGKRARGDGSLIRRAANRHGVACATTIQGGMAVARSLQAGSAASVAVRSLQPHHKSVRHG